MSQEPQQRVDDHSTSAPAAILPEVGLLPITTVARLTGASPSVLRIWEARFGWPRPERTAEGCRRYAWQYIDDIARVVRLTRRGASIRELLVDGHPQWPSTEVAKPVRPALACSDIPLPAGVLARQVRQRLEQALHTQDEGTVAWAIAIAATMRPTDRERAVTAVLARAGHPTIGPIIALPGSSSPVPNATPLPRADPQTGETPMTATPTPPADVPATSEVTMGTTLPTSPAAPATTNLPFNLVGALRAKMAAEGLSIRKAAHIIGIKHPLLWQVMAHRVLPSATMAPLFAAWLGVDVAVLPRSQGRGSGPSRPATPAPPSVGKPVAVSVTARRTRHGHLPVSKTQGPTVPTMVNRPLDEVLAAVRVALSPPAPVAPVDLHPIMKDQLALAVHTAPAQFRKVIAALLEVSGARIRRRPPGKTGAR